MGTTDALGATLGAYRIALACLIGAILIGLGWTSASGAGRRGTMRLAAAGAVALVFVPALADTFPVASYGGPILGLVAFLSVGLRLFGAAGAPDGHGSMRHPDGLRLEAPDNAVKVK